MNISLPVFLFDKRTMHAVFCYEHKGAPNYLSRAAHCTDKIEMDDCICDITAVYYYNSIKAIQSYSRGNISMQKWRFEYVLRTNCESPYNVKLLLL